MADGNEAQIRLIADQVVDAAIIKTRVSTRKLTLTEIGVIVSILSTVALGVFTLGVLYAQVQTNTARITKTEDRTEQMTTDVAEIKANVEFLAELAKEERSRR